MHVALRSNSPVVALLLAGLLAGCGGTSPGDPAPPSSPTTTPTSTPTSTPTPTAPPATTPPATTPPSTPAPTGPKPIILGVTPNFGPENGGNLVTITGESFSPTPQVLFGSLLATVMTNPPHTATSITVRVPKSNPGWVSVVVVSPDSQYDVAPGAYRYDPAPVN